MPYKVVLIDASDPNPDKPEVVIKEVATMAQAQEIRQNFRQAKWTVERRHNLDTIDHIGLAIRKV